jgi:hypothetical protein
MALTRRVLLRFLGGSALAAALRVELSGSRARADDLPAATAALERIGRRYLGTVPAERDVAILRSQLGVFATPADVLAKVAALEQAVRSDFERGEVVALDGWILSRTELRAAALFALTA